LHCKGIRVHWSRDKTLDKTSKIRQTGTKSLKSRLGPVLESVNLPKYVPDGALPEVPDHLVDGDWLRRRYRISKAGFHNRKNALPSITGVKQGKRVLFTPEEVFVFDACDWYIDQGFTLEEITAAQRTFTGAEVPEPIGPARSTQSEIAISPQADKFARDLAAVVAKAVQQLAPQPQTDPLRPMRLLDEAAEKEYVISTTMLADILGFSTQTVHGFTNPEYRHGFELTKIDRGKWTVKRVKKNNRK
jgi:hypothetical protein